VRLSRLYVRFFRSFNFDYLRKSHAGAKPDPWDLVGPDDQFYPFVRIPIETDITTIVGANESGKSQLLDAMKCLLDGTRIESEDFCRYSKFFTVDNSMALPEFGGAFSNLTPKDASDVRAACGLDTDVPVDEFYFFRQRGAMFIYLNVDGRLQRYEQKSDEPATITLPTWFEIKSSTPLPDSVPLGYLAQASEKSLRPRGKWLAAQEYLRDHIADLATSESSSLAGLTERLREVMSESGTPVEGESTLEQVRAEQLRLAETLLIKVAGIDRRAFAELQQAVKKSEGYANGLVGKMNKQLAERLNFPRWWSQDQDFSLYLTLRDFDLVFTVKDKTGSDYSFSERSEGMKYFLSYFVRFLAFEPTTSPQILLMDEPDQFLSTSGQQDLLKIFQEFAYPEGGGAGVQVIFVTHSPFLIDKNHSQRIRVLEKGDDEEGTRVVRNAARNHFEPLRSAFGSFVAETTFIGNCNLLLEGQADQVLLAGVSSHILRSGSGEECLDLNTLTLVPSGSAEHIPYMVYLATGRDVDQPAIIVLLDGDQEAEKVAAELKRGYRDRQLVDERFVLKTSDLKELKPGISRAQEIEDLIAGPVAAEALKLVASEVLYPSDADEVGKAITEPKPAPEEKMFAAACRVARTASSGLERPLRVDKVAFARAVLQVLDKGGAGTEDTLANFANLFGEINSRKRAAERQNREHRISHIVKRLRRAFLDDHPHSALKTEVTEFLENVDAQLPEAGEEAEAVRAAIRIIRDQHELRSEPRKQVKDFASLKSQIESMSYEGLRRAQTSDAGQDGPARKKLEDLEVSSAMRAAIPSADRPVSEPENSAPSRVELQAGIQ